MCESRTPDVSPAINHGPLASTTVRGTPGERRQYGVPPPASAKAAAGRVRQRSAASEVSAQTVEPRRARRENKPAVDSHSHAGSSDPPTQ